MTRHRLILLFDGTWNDEATSAADTNIVRLQQVMADSLERRSALLANPGRLVAGRTAADQPDVENLVFYERGVGTGALDRLRGGVFGEGLASRIRSGYRTLSFYYQPGDEIFVFGFSRGAYTARSLIGFIGAAGLLTRENCTRALEDEAWSFYRTPPANRLGGIWTRLTPFMHDRDSFRVDCVGVFDTVGALGIPFDAFWRFNREKYEFHDVELSSVTKVNLQALAIDEHREPFEATVWRKPKFKSYESVTEQVWFPGVHADVGGGYLTETARRSLPEGGLDDITLAWLLQRIKHHFPDFPAPRDSPGRTEAALAPQHDSRSLLYQAMPFAWRSIDNRPLRARRWERVVNQDRHQEAMREKIHVSALNRLGATVAVGKRAITYAPRNLIAALDDLAATYVERRSAELESRLTLVGWDGAEFDPENDADNRAARDIIASARDRLIRR